MGLAVLQYVQDYDETYPQAYFYANDVNSSGGYYQWSGTVQPYVKNLGIFICPSDVAGGLAPTNFLGDNGGFGVPEGQTSAAAIADVQAPRLSYIANSNIMPRKRRTADPAQVVPSSLIDEPANEILIAEMTDTPACINDSSAASGVAYKTHRSTNGFATAASGQLTAKWAGESAADYTNPVYAVDYNQISGGNDLWSLCRENSAAAYLHLAYIEPDRHNGGSNYVFADGHAKWYKPQQTLNPQNYLWGKKLHPGANQPILNPATGEPVL